MGTHFPADLIQSEKTGPHTPVGSHVSDHGPLVTQQSTQSRSVSSDEATPLNPDPCELDDDIAFLATSGFDSDVLQKVQNAAKRHGVEAHEELIASEQLKSSDYFQLLAASLDLPFLTSIAPQSIRTDKDHINLVSAIRNQPRLLFASPDNATRLVIAPRQLEVRDLRLRLGTTPALRERIAIASPETIKNALLPILQTPMERHASSMLRRFMPQFSAFAANRSLVVGVCVLSLLGFFALSLFNTSHLTVSLGLLLSALFFVAVCIRLVAAVDLHHHKNQIPHPRRLPCESLPVYSILIALYQEANVVPDLIKSLNALDWPRAKLDIKLIVEAEDEETRAALKDATAGNHIFDIIVVPKGQTKTKPRALNYALTVARGDFVVIYDAEDRPHPLQLRAAFHRFHSADRSTACVQAPLVIDNARRRWLSTMFEIEYASLFDGLLPALSSWRAPVMLGGTSNHFRIEILRGVGAWDPHNVTEDADLGIRLKRFGHNTEMIDVPTFEEAPDKFNVWLKQRTRWFKGWMQTSLVHLRDPGRTLNELGFARFLSLHLYSSLLLISALGHPFFVAYLLIQLGLSLFGVLPDIFFLLAANLVFAYVVHMILAYRSLAYRGKQRLFIYSLTLPGYWLLLSLAAWRALFQLYTAPHFWEKTPHGTVKRRPPPWEVPTRKRISEPPKP